MTTVLEKANSYQPPAAPTTGGNTQPTTGGYEQKPVEEWDYRTDPLDPMGNPLPAGALGWTPYGTPYFGPGLGGTLKRYWWTVSGKPQSGAPAQQWAQLQDTSALTGDFWKTQAQLLFGATTDMKAGEALAQGSDIGKRVMEIQQEYGVVGMPALRDDAPDEIKAEYDELQKQNRQLAAQLGNVDINNRTFSLLQPILRIGEAGLQMLGDAANEAAVKFEQYGGALQAAREYADTHGSELPGLTMENTYAPEGTAWARGMDNVVHALLPFFGTWDTFRLFTAEGSLEDKKRAWQEGWDAGRLLYTQTIKPVVLEEYKHRVADGEDPYLVALALQDPWAEGIGQTLLDPLNVVGLLGDITKVSKANAAARAETVTSLGDEIAPLLNKATKNPMGDVRASETMKKIDDLLVNNTKRIESTLVTDLDKATDLSPSGLRIVETKAVMRASNNLVGSIMRGGGSYDDVADIFLAGVKVVSPDLATRTEGLNALMTLSGQFQLGRYPFSDDVMKSFTILRNLADEEVFKNLPIAKQNKAKNLLELLKANPGKDEKTALTLRRAFEEAVEYQTPTVKDLRKAAEAAAKGGADARTADLAQRYQSLKPTTKLAWQIEENTVGNFKRWVNGALSKFYFSTPGFVSRNTMNNFVTMLVDSGPTKTFRAMLWKDSDIDQWARSYFGGRVPPAFEGFTLVRSEKGQTSISRLNDRVEQSFAKRIYWSRFRESMDHFLQPGVTLPGRAEFKAAGMTDAQVDDFLHILRGEAAGNVDTALIRYAERHGDSQMADAWKSWNGAVAPEEMRALKEWYADKALDKLVSDPNATPQTIRQTIQTMRDDMRKMAEKAAESPVQDVGGLTKYVEEGVIGIDDYNKMNILEQQYALAADELERALFEARRLYPNANFDPYIEAFSRTASTKVAQRARDLIDDAWKVTKTVKKGATHADLVKLWEKSILGHLPVPPNLTGQRLLDELWPAVKNLRMLEWDKHFAAQFQKVGAFIGGFNDPKLTGIFKKAQKANARLQMYRDAVYAGGKIYAVPPAKNIRELASRYGISTAQAGTGDAIKGADKHILNAINKYSGTNYKTLDEIPLDQAEKAFKDRSVVKEFGATAEQQAERTMESASRETDKLAEIQPPEEISTGPKLPPGAKQITPPEVDGAPPLPGQVAHHSIERMNATLNKVEDFMLTNYGLKNPDPFGPSTLSQVRKLLTSAGKDGLTPMSRVNEAIAMADKVGQHWRDFALLPYGETRNFELALSYVYPYGFWYGRTYRNWLNRLAQDPNTIAAYFRLKDTMAKANKDSPQWWRYNLTVPSHFLGMPNEHPLSFNLEANLWPLYGITGTDFNDPEKRVNWWTATIDDMGKFGPSIWAPINIATAVILNSQNEQDAAARWAGRLIPQTATIKAASSILNPDGQPLELDPSVQLFSGDGLGDFAAMDPYEINRVGRMLTSLAQQDPQNAEAYFEAARTRSGPLWEKAVREATHMRAGGQIASFMLGVGFKARTEEDRQIDAFYNDYRRLQSLSDAGLIAPERMREAWDSLRAQYPFMDTLLLSRKAGDARDRAYAYNVMSRIPPGQTSELLEIVGVDKETADKFYENAGDLSFLSEPERQQFVAAMMNLGAMLALPDEATRASWNDARSSYKEMQTQLEKEFGKGTLDAIQDYYNMSAEDARLARDSNPKIMAALQRQNELILSNPTLYQYYGSIRTIESYEYGKMYDQLEERYGADIVKLASTYNELKDLLQHEDAAAFLKAHPQIRDYWRDKSKMSDQVVRSIARLANYLPDPATVELYGTPTNPRQTAIAEYAQPPAQPTYAEWREALGEPLMDLVTDFFVNGDDLPRDAENALEYRARQYGYESVDDLLQALGIALFGVTYQ